MTENIQVARKGELRKILQKHNLDALLLYSTNAESGLSQWIGGLRCTSGFHYYFIDRKKSGFLEVQYRASDLKRYTNEKVYEYEDENIVDEYLVHFLSPYNKVGLAGVVPYIHIKNVKAHFEDVTPEVNHLIVRKSSEEISEISKLAHQLISTLEASSKIIKPGSNQLMLKEFYETQVRAFADRFSFPLCITSGKDLAESTIHTPSLIAFQEKDTICVDIGAYKNGFYTDCTRCFFINNSEPKHEYEKLVSAHHAIIKKLKIGMTSEEVKDSYVHELEKQDLPYKTLEIQYLGHSIGFFLHEDPFFYQEKSKHFKLVEGMIFTLEPEIIYPSYRLRVEDMIVIKNGKAEILTRT